MSCPNPRATKRIINPGTGPKAWCGRCKAWIPAAQVPWDGMRTTGNGRITATFAPKPH